MASNGFKLTGHPHVIWKEDRRPEPDRERLYKGLRFVIEICDGEFGP
jgi:hypothetical protein